MSLAVLDANNEWRREHFELLAVIEFSSGAASLLLLLSLKRLCGLDRRRMSVIVRDSAGKVCFYHFSLVSPFDSLPY